MFCKLLIAVQAVFFMALLEPMLFFSVPMNRIVRLAKRYPVLHFGLSDEQIISVINRVLYPKVRIMHFFVGNCVRYSTLGYLFLSKRHIGLKVVIGVRKIKGELLAHSWLENCTKSIYEPSSTEKQYTRLGEFKG